jgi:hypothetical protein
LEVNQIALGIALISDWQGGPQAECELRLFPRFPSSCSAGVCHHTEYIDSFTAFGVTVLRGLTCLFSQEQDGVSRPGEPYLPTLLSPTHMLEVGMLQVYVHVVTQ